MLWSRASKIGYRRRYKIALFVKTGATECAIMHPSERNGEIKMKKLLVAILLSASFSVNADSCNNIILYAMNNAKDNWGSEARLVSQPMHVSIYKDTCKTAITAKGVISKDDFYEGIKNGSSAVLEKHGYIDAADVNSLVAKISYDFATE